MTIQEGQLSWTFDRDWRALKYDEMSFYRKHLQAFAGGCKGVDVVALSPDGSALWLLEAKDFSFGTRAKRKGPLPEEIAHKVRDTLAGLVAIAANAQGGEQTFAAGAVSARTIRVVLHFEQPRRRTKIFGGGLDPADVKMKLKRLLKPVDRRPLVVTSKTSGLPWSSTWAPKRGSSS